MTGQEYRRSYLPIIVGVLFVLFIIFVSLRFASQAKKANDDLIAEHIEKLSDIFKKINETCQITGFAHSKDHIDFLNVKNFTGNTIGSMRLTKPENWQGPYLDNNLVIEGKEYQIVRAKNGYYILPGDGVDLANGAIIGKTIKITPKADIEALMRDRKFLLSRGKPLAAYIEVTEDPHRKSVDETIARDISTLTDIFKRINKTCKILGFRHARDHIDFLNVERFVGPVVGCMNLENPENWQGPYLDKNLTVESKFYQIVKTKKGYYIVPDNGVELSNGQVIGQTLIITSDADLDSWVLDPKKLLSNHKPLAAKIEIAVQNPVKALTEDDILDESPDVNY